MTLEARAQAPCRDQRGGERRSGAGRGAEIGAPHRETEQRTAGETRERQAVDDRGASQQLAIRDAERDGCADRERSLRRDCETARSALAVPTTGAVATATPRRRRKLDFDASGADGRDDAVRRAVAGGLGRCHHYSATSEDAMVRTVCRGTSPTAVTLRPRSVSENVFVLPTFEKPSLTSALAFGSSMNTDTVASPSE